jgi:hypothetical protein
MISKFIVIHGFISAMRDIIPSTWSEGYIIQIYKGKGSKLSPENYRPIAILSCLSKIFTSVLNDRLTRFVKLHLEKHVNSWSCVYIEFSHRIKKKKKLYVGFIDFSRAFDNLQRAQLFQKLIDTEINGKFLRLNRNMYKGSSKMAIVQQCYRAILGSVKGKICPHFYFPCILMTF